LSKSASRARLAEIIRKRSFGRGEITLASGRKSDFYFNLKPTMLDPEGAALLAELTYEALKDDGLDYIGGLEMGAVPLAGAIAQLSWIKGHPIAAFFVRKKPKEHGARLAVEGLTARKARPIRSWKRASLSARSTRRPNFSRTDRGSELWLVIRNQTEAMSVFVVTRALAHSSFTIPH